ncbi:MAG: PHP domain-containing protein [Leptolinea sp.]|jgi:predicted metal-dependent phosphoesterase TrpH|nr:PHP domain-containing protein [Leptolinea sp.]
MDESLLKVDFHCHCDASPDSLVRPAELVTAARQRGLDRLVVTDHNTIRGAMRCRELDPELIIVGEEVQTTSSELLAAFVTEEVPRDLEPKEAIKRLRDQGAFISISHPFDPHRGWPLADLLEIIDLVDAVEVFNARCYRPEWNAQAFDFAGEHGKPGTVGSDSHSLYEVGGATILLPAFTTAEDLRAVIGQGTVEAELASPLVRLGSRYAKWVKTFLPAQES